MNLKISKKNALSIFFYIFMILCAPLAFSQEVQFSGSLTTQAGLGLPNTHDNKGKFLVGSTAFDGIIKSYLNESMVYINGKLIYDALASQVSNGTEALVSEDGTFALKLKEAYIDYNGEWWAMRVGRQISAWGKADGIQVADILCPQDESTLIATTYKESRLGIDALRLSLTGTSLQADAYWIPFFTPSPLPANAPVKNRDLETPEKKLSNSEFAGRISGNFSALDFSLYGFYGWDDLPVGSTYERVLMFGADTAIPKGDFIFRFEGAVFPNRYIKAEKESEKHNQLIALAGFDWDVGSGCTVTAQYVGDCIFGNTDEITRKQYQHQATLSIEQNLLNETVTLSAQGALDLRDFSSNTELTAEYSLSDAIKLSLIGNIFLEGPEGKKGLFGDYHDMSCLTLKAKLSF